MCDKDYISLKEYFDVRFAELEKRLNVQQAAEEKASKLFTELLDHRLATLNGVRAQLTEQAQTFITRQESELKRAILEKEIKAIQRYVWMALGACTLLGYVISYFTK